MQLDEHEKKDGKFREHSNLKSGNGSSVEGERDFDGYLYVINMRKRHSFGYLIDGLTHQIHLFSVGTYARDQKVAVLRGPRWMLNCSHCPGLHISHPCYIP